MRRAERYLRHDLDHYAHHLESEITESGYPHRIFGEGAPQSSLHHLAQSRYQAKR